MLAFSIVPRASTRCQHQGPRPAVRQIELSSQTFSPSMQPASSAFSSSKESKRTANSPGASRIHRQMEIPSASAFSPKPILMGKRRYSSSPDFLHGIHRTIRVWVGRQRRSLQREDFCSLLPPVSQLHGTDFSSDRAGQNIEPDRSSQHSILQRQLLGNERPDVASPLQQHSLPAHLRLILAGCRMRINSPRSRQGRSPRQAPNQCRRNPANYGEME